MREFIEEFVRENIHFDPIWLDNGVDKKPLMGKLRDSEWVIKELVEVFIDLWNTYENSGEIETGLWTLYPGDRNDPNNYGVELEINGEDEMWNGFVYFDTGLGFDEMESGWTITIDPVDMKSFIRDKRLDILLH